MHCEILDHFFNILFVEIQLKKENLKNVFWMPEFGRPNQFMNGILAMLLIQNWNEEQSETTWKLNGYRMIWNRLSNKINFFKIIY